MGSEGNRSKPHYDITKSRRTRKPWNYTQGVNQAPQNNYHTNKVSSFLREEDNHEEKPKSDRRSLKQLIDGGRGDENATLAGSGCRSTASLSHHFTKEEKQLQVVKKLKDENNNGVKLKGLVSRYAKVLSHLVKVKRERSIGSRKKLILRLKVQ